MPNEPRPSKLPELTRQLLSQAREEVRLAAEVALRAEIHPPEKHARVRRVAYGLSLPFAVFRRLWRDPEARAAYLKVVVPQLAVVAGVAFLLFGVWSDDDVKHTHGWAHALAMVSMVVTILSVAEWIVVAFSNEYHDHLSFRAAALSGVPHERPGRPARVRLDIAWLWSKAKRKIRGILLVAIGLPLLALLELSPVGGHWFYASGVLIWSFYWVAVFALANTPFAWHKPPVPQEPFFLRGVARLSTVPFIGFFARLYIAIARRVSGSVHDACQAFEQEAPYEAIGLAATRFVLGFPGLYLLSRPLFPVAATHALMARRFPREPDGSGAPFRTRVPEIPLDTNDPNAHGAASPTNEPHGDIHQVEGRIDLTNP